MTAMTDVSELAPLPARKSLRARAFAATVGLLVYVLASATYVALERTSIYDSMQTLQVVSRHEKALALAEAAVNGALIDVSEHGSAERPEATPPFELALYMETCNKLFAALEEFDPRYTLLQRAIQRSFDELQAAASRANWLQLREALARASEELEIQHRGLNQRRDDLTLRYQRQYDAVTVESLLLSLLGIAVFGAMVAWFFSRLTGDIRRLESHARQIVRGARGVAFPVAREDELGRLMHAVNQMSSDLQQRETQIELETERRSHQDKMIAVGALAAGVAHEVNNPLAVIAGTAQELCAQPPGRSAEDIRQAAQLILAQTERAAFAAQNLAEIATPQPTVFDWVDVNAMVRRTLQLLQYDKRYRHIAFEQDLPGNLPAIRTTGAVLQHVLMQLLTLVCDTLPARRGSASVRIATHHAGDRMEIELVGPVALDFTQPEVMRALLLVRANIEPLGARIELDHDTGPGQRIRLTWPADSGRDE